MARDGQLISKVFRSSMQGATTEFIGLQEFIPLLEYILQNTEIKLPMAGNKVTLTCLNTVK